jgi:hypothetical protein
MHLVPWSILLALLPKSLQSKRNGHQERISPNRSDRWRHEQYTSNHSSRTWLPLIASPRSCHGGSQLAGWRAVLGACRHCWMASAAPPSELAPLGIVSHCGCRLKRSSRRVGSMLALCPFTLAPSYLISSCHAGLHVAWAVAKLSDGSFWTLLPSASNANWLVIFTLSYARNLRFWCFPNAVNISYFIEDMVAVLKEKPISKVMVFHHLFRYFI